MADLEQVAEASRMTRRSGWATSSSSRPSAGRRATSTATATASMSMLFIACWTTASRSCGDIMPCSTRGAETVRSAHSPTCAAPRARHQGTAMASMRLPCHAMSTIVVLPRRASWSSARRTSTSGGICAPWRVGVVDRGVVAQIEIPHQGALASTSWWETSVMATSSLTSARPALTCAHPSSGHRDTAAARRRVIGPSTDGCSARDPT